MIQEIEVPDDKDLWSYFTDKTMTQDYIDCFSSFIRVEYDDEGNEVYTKQERARQWVTSHLDAVFEKWQRRQAASAAVIKSGGIS